MKKQSKLLFKICLLFLFFPIYISFCDEQINNAQIYYLKGKELMLKGDYKSAEEFFKKAEEILDKLTSSSAEQKIGKESPKIFIEKKKEEKKDKDILEEAEHAFQKEEYDKALSIYKEILKKYPQNPDIYYNLGVIYLKKSNYIQAAHYFEKVIQLNPSDKDAYYNLGVLYESYLNDKKKAISYYQKYLRLASFEEKKEIKKWIKEIKRILRDDH